jgi:hypothetical protein
VVGQITNNGAPVSGATVTSSPGDTTISASDGSYSVNVKTGSSVTITATYNGKSRSITVTMPATPSTITGQNIDIASATAVVATPTPTPTLTQTPTPTPTPNNGPAAVNLGTAGNYVILTKSGISTTGTTHITGDIAVSPIASTAITGFGLIADSSNKFSTSSLVTGKVYAANYAVPTPATLTTAVSDMETAYTDAAGRSNPDATGLGAGEIGGLTISPGLYKWGTGVSITTDVTLNAGGNSNAVWIFQIGQGLTVASGKKVILSGGAQANNIFWQVSSNAEIGTGAQFNGNILAKTAINLRTGASINGRILAQTAVTLDANAVTRP